MEHRELSVIENNPDPFQTPTQSPDKKLPTSFKIIRKKTSKSTPKTGGLKQRKQ